MAELQPQGVFIDEHRQVIEGESALSLLMEKGEARFVEHGRGIVRVDRSRWEEAQRYETLTWMRDGRFAVDDRNEYHQVRFANYAALHQKTFSRGIELGCGPFTNFRLILQYCQVREVYLLDPLIGTYLQHLFCAYPDGRLGGIFRARLLLRDLRHPAAFIRSRRNAYQIGGLCGRQVHLISSTIEELCTDLDFDLVVMVNVLEHCRDADLVFDKILKLLSPGGTFVFADVAWNTEDIDRLVTLSYDAGHPLRIGYSVVKQFLAQHFFPLMYEEQQNESEVGEMRLRKRELYFIGTKV